jgi:hypothetical protein
MSDPRERLDDKEETMRVVVEGIISGLWTALPGIINSVNFAAMTCTVQPTIMGQLRAPDGTTSLVQMPLLLDVPIMFQGGGGYIATFPIEEGDECLVVFASRCIDGWWQSGGVQPQAELRMHDLSDGFAFVGPKSQPNVVEGISATTAQLRSVDGNTSIDIDNATNTVTVKGNLVVTGNVTGNRGGSYVDLLNHQHQNGGGTGLSGPPQPGT